MLVARETLTIAGHVCKGVCDCGCEPELDDELRNIGLSPEEVDEAKNIIIRYLEKDKGFFFYFIWLMNVACKDFFVLKIV